MAKKIKITNKKRDVIDYGIEIITFGKIKPRTYEYTENGKKKERLSSSFSSFKKNVIDK